MEPFQPASPAAVSCTPSSTVSNSAVPQPFPFTLPHVPLSSFIPQGFWRPYLPSVSKSGKAGGVREVRGVYECWSQPEQCPNEKTGKAANPTCQAPPPGQGTRPCLILNASNGLNPGEPSTVRQEKPKKWRQSLWDTAGGTAGSTASAGAAALVCVWVGGERGYTSVLIALGLVKASRPEPGHVTG